MKCANCGSVVGSKTGLCEECGYENNLLVLNNQSNRDSLILVLYISWAFLVNILFNLINKFVIPGMIARGSGQKISLLMSTLDFIISGVDFILIILIIFLLKNKLAKIFFMVFLFSRIALFVLNSVKF